jgi:hypothetical protein
VIVEDFGDAAVGNKPRYRRYGPSFGTVTIDDGAWCSSNTGDLAAQR